MRRALMALRSGAASLTGRYIKSVRESQANDNKLNSRLYIDAQARFLPPVFSDNLNFAVGVNNLSDKYRPGFINSGLNNFDPTTYGVPGHYYYARATVKM